MGYQQWKNSLYISRDGIHKNRKVSTVKEWAFAAPKHPFGIQGVANGRPGSNIH